MKTVAQLEIIEGKTLASVNIYKDFSPDTNAQRKTEIFGNDFFITD